MVRRKIVGALWRRRWQVALVLSLAALLAVRVPLSASGTADFPQHTPAALAHFLADFSNHRQLDETIGAWWVEEEASNYTWWEYVVGFECGARCRGRAELRAAALHDAGGNLRHGAAANHRLRLRERRCLTLPLLPWPSICEENETEMVVSPRDGGGSRLTQHVRVWCGALAALSAGCRPHAPRHELARALRRPVFAAALR